MRQVIDYPNYFVKKDGRIWSKKKQVWLIPRKNCYGYLEVRFFIKKVGKKSFRNHRLVAQAFIPNPNNYPQVNHKNGIKEDNRVENLEWCTNKQNHEHASKLGLHKNKSKGMNHGRAKLTDQKIYEIRNNYSTGNYSQRELGKLFNVSSFTIGAILRKEIWRHL